MSRCSIRHTGERLALHAGLWLDMDRQKVASIIQASTKAGSPTSYEWRHFITRPHRRCLLLRQPVQVVDQPVYLPSSSLVSASGSVALASRMRSTSRTKGRCLAALSLGMGMRSTV